MIGIDFIVLKMALVLAEIIGSYSDSGLSGKKFELARSSFSSCSIKIPLH